MAIDLPQTITAVGGLGTAAFGIVDATKVFGGGISNVGFGRIARTVASLTPSASVNQSPAMSQDQILATLKSNWLNGTDLGSQKSIAKSLVKLTLGPHNASALARSTGLNADALQNVTTKVASGEPLTSAESDLLARFDFIVTALLDEAYQRGDRQYRNSTRALATLVAIALGLVGAAVIQESLLKGLVVGVLATPVAPIAKDLSTALATAVNALQAVRR